MKGTKSDRETLRARVKVALGERTQKELEQALGVSGGTLSRVFGGRRNVDAVFLRDLADGLGVEVERLLHGTDFLLLFDGAELPREAGDVDVVAPLPPPPTDGPPPVESLPSRGGPAADVVPDASPAADPDGSDGVTPSEEDTDPLVTVVDGRVATNDAPKPEPDQDDTTAAVDEPIVAVPPSADGLKGRIRRFLSGLFGG